MENMEQFTEKRLVATFSKLSSVSRRIIVKNAEMLLSHEEVLLRTCRKTAGQLPVSPTKRQPVAVL